MSNSLQPYELQQARLLCPSLSPRLFSNSRPLSRWCHPTISSSATPYLLAFNLSQHQGLFHWVDSLHQVAKVLELQLQHQSFQWIFVVDFLLDWLLWSPCSPRDSQESSLAWQFESINSLVLSLLYGLTSLHDYWKNDSFNYMDLCWQHFIESKLWFFQ